MMFTSLSVQLNEYLEIYNPCSHHLSEDTGHLQSLRKFLPAPSQPTLLLSHPN